MNLSGFGAFADGAVRGYTNMEELKLKQRTADNEEKRMQWAQDDHDYQVQQRKRDQDLKDNLSGLIKSTYAQPGDDEQTAVDPSAAPVATAQPAGNLATAPAQPQVAPATGPTQFASPSSGGEVPAPATAPAATPTAVPKAPASRKPRMGEDPLVDANFMIQASAMKFAHSGDPEILMKAHEYVTKMKETDSGKMIMGALAGDEKAKAQLFKMEGLDPATAKIVTDPTKNIFQIQAPGKTIDLSHLAMYLGADKAYTIMKDTAETSQKAELFPLQKKHLETGIEAQNATIGKTKAETEQLIPAHVESLRADAQFKRARGSALADVSAKEKFGQAISKYKFTTTDDNGKPIASSEATAYIGALATGPMKDKNPDVAAANAANAYRMARQSAESDIAKLPPDVLKQQLKKFNGNQDKLRDAIAHRKIEKLYGDQLSPMPTAEELQTRKRNLTSTSTTDTE